MDSVFGNYGWLLALVLFSGCREAEAPRVFPEGEMQEGDLAFRCGMGVFSRAVTTVEDEGVYSHVGILLKDGEDWFVVHAVPGETEFRGDFDRVKKEPLAVFYGPRRAKRGCLVHTGLDDSLKVENLRRTALQMARDSVAFDGDYDLTDSARVYCTELVWRLYRREGIDLSEGRRQRVNALQIHGDCLLPEHLLKYRNNVIYHHF